MSHDLQAGDIVQVSTERAIQKIVKFEQITRYRNRGPLFPQVLCYGSMDRSDRNGVLESKSQQDDGRDVHKLSRSVPT